MFPEEFPEENLANTTTWPDVTPPAAGTLLFVLSRLPYGYRATHIALSAVRVYLDSGKANPAKLDRIAFCIWNDEDGDVYQ